MFKHFVLLVLILPAFGNEEETTLLQTHETTKLEAIAVDQGNLTAESCDGNYGASSRVPNYRSGQENTDPPQQACPSDQPTCKGFQYYPSHNYISWGQCAVQACNRDYVEVPGVVRLWDGRGKNQDGSSTRRRTSGAGYGRVQDGNAVVDELMCPESVPTCTGYTEGQKKLLGQANNGGLHRSRRRRTLA
jgi:hypothetical protein